MSKPLVILSLGGSLISPEGVDTSFLADFRSFVISELSSYRFILVCGGGAPARTYQNAAKKLGQEDKTVLDWVGIRATLLNAQLVHSIFDPKLVYPHVYDREDLNPDFTQDILVVSGWQPGWSTDYDAVLLAKEYGAKSLINLSNIKYVYDKDPKKHKDAEIIKEMSWTDFRKLVGDTWDPGLNMPFDPIASKLAQELGLTVAIMNGQDLDNLQGYLEGKEFVGSLIKP